MLAVDRCHMHAVLPKESMVLAKAMLPRANDERKRVGLLEKGPFGMVTAHSFSIRQGYIDLGLNVALSLNNIF